MGAIKLMTSLFQDYSLFETWGPLWLALVIWLGYSYKKHIVNSPEYEVGSGREKFFYTGIVLLYLLHGSPFSIIADRSEEHTSELQSRFDLVCRLLLEQK